MPDSPAAAAPANSDVRVLNLLRPSHPIYKSFGDEGFVAALMKEVASRPADGQSAQGAYWGEKAHPFDMEAVAIFKHANGHHSTCIETKVGATVGIGFKSDKAAKALDPLVRGVNLSFQDVLTAACDDFWATGNGYIEVVRRNGKITGIHHVESKRVFVYVEENQIDIHYLVSGTAANSDRVLDVRMAKFGDADFARRNPTLLDKNGNYSEIIHFRRPTALSRYYGFPDWLAAVAAIELIQCMHQDKFDYHLNRGVPEFMLWVIGQKLPPADWEKIETGLKATIGNGNQHKTMAVNIQSDPAATEVQIDKLAMEGGQDALSFSSLHETLSLEIVSAHRIPPMLAGIAMPGKLGAANELPNALMACQVLVIGPAQHIFETALRRTLGSTDTGLGLSDADFDLKEITEEIDLGIADTVGRMKEPLAGAKASGRDLSAGLKKEDADPVMDEAVAHVVGQVFSMALRRNMARRRAA